MSRIGRGTVLLAMVAGLAMPALSSFATDAALDGQWLDAAWDFDRPAESEARFRARLAALPEGSAARLELSTQVARAQGLQREFDAAHSTLDAVERALPGSPERVAVRYLLERGRVLNSSGHEQQAMPLFRDALARARAAGEDFLAIDAAHMLGIAAAPNERLRWDMEALEMTEQSGDARARRWLAPLYNNIGWVYHDRGDYATALGYFQKALPEWAERGDPRKVRVARWTIGRALRSLGRYDEALRIQKQLVAEPASGGAVDGFIYEELGELLLAKGETDAARPNFARAFALLAHDADLQESEPERLARMRLLGGLK